MFNIFAFTFKIVSWTHVFFFTFTIFQRLSVVCKKINPKNHQTRTDGSVVSWGSPFCGGDSTLVRADLQGVLSVAATLRAFAALRCLVLQRLFFFCMVKLVKDITPGKTNMAMEHPQFLIGDASSNGWCSISVFPGVHQRLVPVPPIFKYTHFSTSMIPR